MTAVVRIGSVAWPVALALWAALGLAPASAQAPPTGATPQAPSAPSAAPNAGTGAGNCKPGLVAPKGAVPKGSETTTGQGGRSPGDELAKSDGVLCPPSNVDPEIRAPTPEGGNTPVIPPPGSPGGNPTLRPK